MNYRVPRPLYESLAEKLKDRSLAEQFVLSIEDAVDEIDRGVHGGISERVGGIKMEVKEDLSKILVTRERFEALEDHLDERFNGVDLRFQAMQRQMDLRFNSIQLHIDERFKRIDLKFNVLIGLLIAGFTLFNPGFLELLKMVIK